MSDFSSLPDAEAQCRQLAELIRPRLVARPALVGIYSGGAWVAGRLKELLGLTEDIGLIDVSFYRDDFSEKGLHPQCRPTEIPFAVEGRHIILVDDVLYTGRTTRAAINELFSRFIPLYSVNFGWVVPAFVGGLVGCLRSRTQDQVGESLLTEQHGKSA